MSTKGMHLHTSTATYKPKQTNKQQQKKLEITQMAENVSSTCTTDRIKNYELIAVQQWESVGVSWSESKIP
jgi:predicted RNase H-like nuclease